MNYLDIVPARAVGRKWPKLIKLFESGLYTMEEKFDGWRFLMHFGKCLDRTYMTGRRTSKRTGRLSEKGLNAPMLTPHIQPDGYTVLDGEVLPPIGASFRDIAGIMNSDIETAAANIATLGPPRYVPFDILFWDGKDVRNLPHDERRDLLLNVEIECFVRDGLIQCANSYPANPDSYREWCDAGKEGAILKLASAPYGAPNVWFKVKRFSNIDVVVMGYTDARYGKTGKYDGLIGAVKIGVWKDNVLVQVGQVSGMDDEMRHHFTENQEQLLGTVVEVRAQWFGENKLIHPRYKRMRSDKPSNECTWDSMMEALESNDNTGE